MNAQRFHNLGDYLAEFLATLRIQQDTLDEHNFKVEVDDDGLSADDLALLR